jgi:hypothetical protein
MTLIARRGPFVPCLGESDTLAALILSNPATTVERGTLAYCVDAGWVYSDGSTWSPIEVGAASAFQYITSGASGTVSSGVDTVILNGVNTTFALTFPVPIREGQELRVQAAAAVSVAFSTVATAPATTIKTTPATLAAGVGCAWVYHVADTTWYRLY